MPPAGSCRPSSTANLPFPTWASGNTNPKDIVPLLKSATCADYPADGNKIVPSLKEALVKAGLQDGMTISTHHHFRNGDLVATQIFDIAHELGIKDLMWFPSASFPCHEPMTKYLEDGTINHIEGSMNGALGQVHLRGKNERAWAFCVRMADGTRRFRMAKCISILP